MSPETLTPNYRAFKKWIVKRPDGGRQVLLPLSELDATIDEACAPLRTRLEAAEKENVYLRANMPMSVLRRLQQQAAIAGEE